MDEGPFTMCLSKNGLAVRELCVMHLQRGGRSRPGQTWVILGQAQRWGPCQVVFTGLNYESTSKRAQILSSRIALTQCALQAELPRINEFINDSSPTDLPYVILSCLNSIVIT